MHILFATFECSYPDFGKTQFRLYFQWEFGIATYYFFDKYKCKAKRNKEIDGGGKNWTGGGFLFGGVLEAPLFQGCYKRLSG